MNNRQQTTSRPRKMPSAAQLAASRERRAALIALSRPIQAARKGGLLPWAEFATVNECLVLIYQRRTGQTDFETFMGWKERGFSVKKGETGFAIWGTPLSAHRGQPDDQPAAATDHAGAPDADAEPASWFPLCYLFHAGQVADANGETPAFNPVALAFAQAKAAPLALPAPADVRAPVAA